MFSLPQELIIKNFPILNRKQSVGEGRKKCKSTSHFVKLHLRSSHCRPSKEDGQKKRWKPHFRQGQPVLAQPLQLKSLDPIFPPQHGQTMYLEIQQNPDQFNLEFN